MENIKSISIQNLSIQFGSRKLFSNVNLELLPNSIYALIGPNGSGKTSLLNAIASKIDYAGTIKLHNQNLKAFNSRSLAQTISYLPSQNPSNSIQVSELIELNRFPHTKFLGKLKEKDLAVVSKSIELTGVENLLDKNFTNLSDGEKKKVMITASLVQDCPIMMMDEPTNFLDIGNKYQFSKLLQEIRDELGKTIIISTHDMNLAFQGADHILLIQEENILTKEPNEVKKEKLLEKVFASYGIKMDESGNLKFE